MVINGKSPEEYFGPRELFQHQLRMPFEVVGAGGYNVMVRVRGGGVAGQVGAVRHGIARALVDVSPDNRQPLKRTKVEDGNSLLTRDPRAKERKKVGLKRARKAPQYTKR
jgi:small subunit ribosomal protein S9